MSEPTPPSSATPPPPEPTTQTRPAQPAAEAAREEAIAHAEARLDRLRQTIGMVAGPLLFGLILWWSPTGLSAEGTRLLAALVLCIVWWVTEALPLPVTALVGPVLCVALGLGSAKDVLAAFADPIIFIFIGSFILAQSMTVHGLDRRFALRLMGLGWVGDSLPRLLFMFGAIAALLSMWLSNTACTAMLIPIGIGIIGEARGLMQRQGTPLPAGRLKFATAIMLMTAYSASAGGLGTPIGTPPNLIGLNFINKQITDRPPITFLEWMMFAVPLVIIMYVGLYAILMMLFPPETRRIEGLSSYIQHRRRELGHWTRGQRNTMVAFGVAVALWVLPGVLALVLGPEAPALKWMRARLPEGSIALLAAALLFVLPIHWPTRRFTLTWRQAQDIDWGTVLLFGGGIALGNLADKTGLAQWIGNELVHTTGLSGRVAITLVAVGLSIMVSELASNTASATVMVPLMIAISKEAGIDPMGPALGATLGASFGFMLPVSTGPNAMVYGTGQIPLTKMIQAGAIFDVIGFVIISTAVLLVF